MLEKLKTVDLKSATLPALRNILAMLDKERAALIAKEKEVSEAIAAHEQAAIKARGPNPLGVKKIG